MQWLIKCRQAAEKLATLLDFGQTMMGAVKNLQGNMTAATK
ncbi:MAG: hypothetical protein ACM3X1_02185 [Ignavibacteriales bacterium]